MASFSCELLCRACMEPFSGGSMPLISKKKNRKTEICKNYESLTCLKVKITDLLPQQLCLTCVSELNKSFTFKEKCLRTNNQLKTYLDLESDDDDEFETEQYVIENLSTPARPKRSTRQTLEHKEDQYEEIEITQELVDAAKAQSDNQDSEMVLEVEEICHNLLNTAAKNDTSDKNNFVYIIQNIPGSTIVASSLQVDNNMIEVDDKQEEMMPECAKGKFKCTICEMEFVRKKNFDNHNKRFHENDDEGEPDKKRLRLRLTNEKDTQDEQFKQNLEENPEAKKCKICGALYMNEKSLKLHERRNACKQNSYQCDICNKVFTDSKMFIDHNKNHPHQQEKQEEQPQEPETAADPSKKFQCNVCSRSFKMSSTLKDHLRTHTGDKPYVCTICSRGFSQNTNLKQHLRRHTQIKPFKCSYDNCTAAFVSKGELDSHNRTHTGDHPFKCDQCDTKFTTSSSLLKHKRIHSGEKPYACEFCPLRFTALGTLRNHERTHTGQKPHTCRYCERAFTQRSDMSAHERTHTGDRPYVCKVCNSAFHQSGTLKTHMKIHKKSEAAE